MLSDDDARRARESLAAVLDSIDSGEVEASKAQRAHIAGAAAALAELAPEAGHEDDARS
jgi:hypothetical protein